MDADAIIIGAGACGLMCGIGGLSSVKKSSCWKKEKPGAKILILRVVSSNCYQSVCY